MNTTKCISINIYHNEFHEGFFFKEVPQVGQKTNKLKLVYVIVICIYLQAIYKITFHIINFT
jgi:hypothetical protein